MIPIVGAGLERFAFSSENDPDAHGFDAYREMYSIGSRVERIGGRFVAEANFIRYPRMMVADRTLAGLSHERSHRRVAKDGFDHVNLQLVVSGRMMLSTYDTPRIVETGQIAVFDMTRPQRTWTLGARIIAASLPRDMLTKLLPPDVLLHGLVLAEPHCGLLGDVLRSLVRTGSPTDSVLAEAATATVASLIGATLGFASGSAPDRTGDDRILEEARRDRAMAVIDDMLHQPDLLPETIAGAAGMSRSTLYRLFEPFGGVARYIQQRRLAALRRILSRPGEFRAFATLALDHGFASPSHASRSFKDQYGMTPGEIRSAPRGPMVRTSGIDGRRTLARWTGDLM